MTRVAAHQAGTVSEPSDLLRSGRGVFIPVAIGLMSFLTTESMHYLLVPDIGRRWERWLAEAVSAIAVSLLTAKVLHIANQRREATLLRMQVISEMNHHIRNALATISLSTQSIENQQSIRLISGSVDRIEWALREILLRPRPLPESEANQLRYVQPQKKSKDHNEIHS